MHPDQSHPQFRTRQRQGAAGLCRCGLALLGVGLWLGSAQLSAQLADAMDGSVVADVGDYNYTGTQYDPVGPDIIIDGPVEVAGTVAGTINEAAAFLDRSSSFGAWTNFHDGRGFLGAQGGVRPALSRFPFARGPYPYPTGRGLHLGPLYVGDFYAGAGLMYSEYQGSPLTRPRVVGADNWASILWTSFRVSAYLSDTFALSIRPYVYYLPFEGRVGYSVGNTIGLSLDGSLLPHSLVEMGYHVPVGRWDFYAHDSFDVRLAQPSILDNDLFYRATLQDHNYDAAGLRGFGSFGVPIADSTGVADFDVNDRLFDTERTIFRNFASASLNGWLSEDVAATFFYRRTDIWNDSFEHRSGYNTAGALLVQRHPLISKYAGYVVSKRDETDAILHWAYAGVNMALGPRLVADARVGWVWVDAPRGRESGIGRVSLQHQLGPYTYHGIAVGRTVTDPDFGSRYLADFARYYLVHNFTARTEMRIFAQYTEADRLDTNAVSDYTSIVAGVLFSMTLTPLDTVYIMNSYEAYELNNIGREWQLWTHRVAYNRRLSIDSSAQFLYQYQHANSNMVRGNDYSEHLLYLGIVKRF